jgi:hypothetical protein
MGTLPQFGARVNYRRSITLHKFTVIPWFYSVIHLSFLINDINIYSNHSGPTSTNISVSRWSPGHYQSSPWVVSYDTSGNLCAYVYSTSIWMRLLIEVHAEYWGPNSWDYEFINYEQEDFAPFKSTPEVSILLLPIGIRKPIQ